MSKRKSQPTMRFLSLKLAEPIELGQVPQENQWNLSTFSPFVALELHLELIKSMKLKPRK